MKHLDYFIQNTEDSYANFNVALEYESMGQTGSALSFYLRAAERANNDLEQYEALLKCALCFERQGCREYTAEAIIQKALVLLHERPEAYFLMSRLYERKKEWQDCYTYAMLGLKVCNFNLEPLKSDVEYPGWYALYFQKGIASWWVGALEESREIMADLKYSYHMTKVFANAVDSNLASIGYPKFTVSEYKEDMANDIRYKFDNIELITKNYSQSYQDIFVLTMLNGKKNGTYLEIGSAEPFKGNNTALLETTFNWTGASIDINRTVVEEFMDKRDNLVFCLDATNIDYEKFIKKVNLGPNIDFLQVDCDPPRQTFEILKSIPFDTYKFSVISFEHDYYADNSIRDESRKFLQSKGYILVAGNIGYNKIHSYEDWWAHPDLVDADILSKMINTDADVLYAKSYMFPSYK